jgi:chromosome segregation ATPase
MANEHSMEDCPFREKIEKNIDNIKENNHSIKRIMSGDWYSNQELFEMIQSLKSQITEFNQNFSKYNGLIAEREKDRKLLNELHEEVNKIKTEKKTAKETTTNWREWIAWIIAVLLAIDKLGVF